MSATRQHETTTVESQSRFELDETGRMKLLPMNLSQAISTSHSSSSGESTIGEKKTKPAFVLERMTIKCTDFDDPPSNKGMALKRNKSVNDVSKRNLFKTHVTTTKHELPLSHITKKLKLNNNTAIHQGATDRSQKEQTGSKKRPSTKVARKLLLSPVQHANIKICITSPSDEVKLVGDDVPPTSTTAYVVPPPTKLVQPSSLRQKVCTKLFQQQNKENLSPDLKLLDISSQQQITTATTTSNGVSNAMAAAIHEIIESERLAFNAYVNVHENNMRKLLALTKAMCNGDGVFDNRTTTSSSDVDVSGGTTPIRKTRQSFKLSHCKSAPLVATNKNALNSTPSLLNNTAKKAAKLYHSFRNDQSALMTPSLITTTTQTPNTAGRSNRSLSKRLQKQCVLLHDTPDLK